MLKVNKLRWQMVLLFFFASSNATHAQPITTAIFPFHVRTPIAGDPSENRVTQTVQSDLDRSIQSNNSRTTRIGGTTTFPDIQGTQQSRTNRDEKDSSTSSVDIRTNSPAEFRQKDIGSTVAELLTIKLLSSDYVTLVERLEIERIYDELKLSRAGIVNASEATEVGRLTGARLLITGSVVKIEDDLYLIAKVLSTETSRLAGASVKAPVTSKLTDLVDRLATELDSVLSKKAASLLPKIETETDWIAGVKKKLDGKKLPEIVVQMQSKTGKIDLAAVTELERLLKAVGFEVFAWDHPNSRLAALAVVGEARSEFAFRRGDWVATRCRIDLQIRSQPSGKVVASDSETCMVYDITEQTAGKSGLEVAVRKVVARLAAKLAE